ncbi:MAG: hypothetical protein JW717_01155 [Marinilabiliaceae bacterium]|nr:hypothetical protein [Marinilabiliaceae bacterium]
MNVKNELRIIRVIFFAVSVGLFVLFLISYFLVKQKGALVLFTPVQLQYFESVIILLSLAGIPASYYYHKKRMKHLSLEMKPVDLLKSFKSSFFIKLFLTEGLGVLSLVGFMLSANGTFLVIFAIFMVVIIINYPSYSRIADDMQISESELFNTKRLD